MKELKVGERVTIEIVEVTTGSCEGCVFCLHNQIGCGKPYGFGRCSSQRSDGKNVIFKEVKE